MLCRRFKEFAELDTRLRQFYGTIPPLPFIQISYFHFSLSPPPPPADLALPPLPSKRTLRNMDSLFVAGRSRDLQTYLQALLQLPPISSSHLLSSFLSNTSDPSLFMPDSVGERAGTVSLTSSTCHFLSPSLSFSLSFLLSLFLSGKMIKSVTVPGRNKEVSKTHLKCDVIMTSLSINYRKGCC